MNITDLITSQLMSPDVLGKLSGAAQQVYTPQCSIFCSACRCGRQHDVNSTTVLHACACLRDCSFAWF